MRYIGFDGVILDTEDLLFYEWRKNSDRKKLSEAIKIGYIKNSDWGYIIREAPVINDAINRLKNMDYNTSAILTKVHSYKNEGYEKIKYLRECGIKQEIILVPYYMKKNEIVDPNGNILVDDSLKNLTQWYCSGGYPMFFDKNDNNMDSWGLYNDIGYQKVRRIDEERNKHYYS